MATKKNFPLVGRGLLALLICGLALAPLRAQDGEIIKKASSSYYVLRAQGLKDFRCTIELDAETLAESLSLPADDPKRALFSELRFKVSVDEYNRTSVTPFLTTGANIAPDFDQLVGGLRQMIDGFYQSWTGLALTNPFAGSQSGTKVTTREDAYHMTAEAKGMNVEMVLAKDYAIKEISVSSKDAGRTTVWPEFTKTDQGFLLTGYRSSVNNGGMQPTLQIKYQDIEGFKLPGGAVFKIPVSDTLLVVGLTFKEYQIGKMR